MNDISIEYLNKLIPNNWKIISYDNGTIRIYINSRGGDEPNVIHSIEMCEIPYDHFKSALVERIQIDSIDLIDHKSKIRNDKINKILNE